MLLCSISSHLIHDAFTRFFQLINGFAISRINFSRLIFRKVRDFNAANINLAGDDVGDGTGTVFFDERDFTGGFSIFRVPTSRNGALPW
jgi:hypothetical protein